MAADSGGPIGPSVRWGQPGWPAGPTRDRAHVEFFHPSPVRGSGRAGTEAVQHGEGGACGVTAQGVSWALTERRRLQ